MLSDEAKRELLAAASSSSLRDDFARMAANVRQAGAEMSVDDLILFLTVAGRIFSAPRQPPAHELYTRALI